MSPMPIFRVDPARGPAACSSNTAPDRRCRSASDGGTRCFLADAVNCGQTESGKALKFPEGSLRKLQEVLHAGVGAIETALRAGVKVGFGTDLLGETHQAQSKEFALRAKVQSNADVLRSVTIINADLLQRSDRLGVLKPGAFADLLLVDGDPLEDLGVLGGQGERLDVIVRGGVICKNALH